MLKRLLCAILGHDDEEHRPVGGVSTFVCQRCGREEKLDLLSGFERWDG